MLLFLLLSSRMLCGNELSFDDLSAAPYPQEVIMRGFLYRTQSGDLVLASEPNLKSCCVGAKHKSKQQIFVEGDVGNPEAGEVYLLHGIFNVDPGKGIYFLREAYIIKPQTDPIKWSVAFILVIFLAALCLAYLKK